MTDQERLEAIFGPREDPDEPIRCDFLTCMAGMGVAGNRHCFLRGDWRRADCSKYINEEKWLRRGSLAHWRGRLVG